MSIRVLQEKAGAMGDSTPKAKAPMKRKMSLKNLGRKVVNVNRIGNAFKK